MKTKTGRRAVLALTLGGALAAQSALACKVPQEPMSLPDGRTASLQAMQDAKRAVEQYSARVEAYFQCEYNALKLQEVDERERAVVTRFNYAVFAYLQTNSVASVRTARYVPR